MFYIYLFLISDPLFWIFEISGVKSVATLTSNGPIEMRTPQLGYNLMLRNIINVGGEIGTLNKSKGGCNKYYI
jgi:hypothetical protein